MNHIFSECTTDFTSLGLFNSFLTLSIYMLSVIFNYFPTPENLISGVILALVTSFVAFFATKFYVNMYNYIYCRSRKKVKTTTLEIRSTTETDIL